MTVWWAHSEAAIHLDRDRGRAQTLAAAAIRAVLARKSQRIDLIEIASAIIASIRSVPIGDLFFGQGLRPKNHALHSLLQSHRYA
jgi:hypothetical protein